MVWGKPPNHPALIRHAQPVSKALTTALHTPPTTPPIHAPPTPTQPHTTDDSEVDFDLTGEDYKAAADSDSEENLEVKKKRKRIQEEL